MEYIIETFSQPYALRALAASCLVGLACGVLGCFVVLRNLALIGDALSHAVLPGVVAGFWLAGYSLLAFFLGSVAAGVLAAVLITLIQRNVQTKPDSAIGIVFSAMFALGVIGLSGLTRRQGVHLDLKDFLFGNVLGISDGDLMLTALIAAMVVGSVAVFFRYLLLSTFDPVGARTLGIRTSALHYFLMLLTSFAVVASLQSVGVILVVSMLVVPASTALLLTKRLRQTVWLAGGLGVFAAVAGLWLAIVFDTVPGPAMTLVAFSLYALAALFAPGKGILVRATA